MHVNTSLHISLQNLVVSLVPSTSFASVCTYRSLLTTLDSWISNVHNYGRLHPQLLKSRRKRRRQNHQPAVFLETPLPNSYIQSQLRNRHERGLQLSFGFLSYASMVCMTPDNHNSYVCSSTWPPLRCQQPARFFRASVMCSAPPGSNIPSTARSTLRRFFIFHLATGPDIFIYQSHLASSGPWYSRLHIKMCVNSAWC